MAISPILNPNLGKKGRSVEDRFFDSVSPEPNSGCWLWVGAVNACGYGIIGIKYKSTLAHRYSYHLHCGEIPEGFNVLHRCDVPCCVNPEHLFTGTQTDNIHDMENKGRGRHYKGADHGRAKLTEAVVIAIRTTDQRSGDQLAAFYGVSKTAINLARARKSWKHVA